PRLYRPSEVMIFSDDDRMLGSSYSYFVLRTHTTALPPDMYTLPQILGAKNFILGGIQRHVIYNEAPASFTWTIDLPSRPVLSFGAGYLPEGYDPDGADAIFSILLKDSNGKSHTLFDAEMPPPKRLLEMGWAEYSRDISKFANQKIKLTLKTIGTDPEDGMQNSGSWLEPMILNRHISYNIIFLPGKGTYPPEDSIPGAAHEKIAFLTNKTWPLEITKTDNGLPVSVIDMLKLEGWPVGYFYTGLDVAETEKRYGRQYDAVVGNPVTTHESYQEIFGYCIDWIQRLEGRNFVLVFNPVYSDDDESLEMLDIVSDWLLSHRFDTDSLMVLYNYEEDSRVWLLNPSDPGQKQLEISTWSDMTDYIISDVLEIEK
ncbi:hypothetical protein K8T06_11565, partial [bacterium]|nr:hypothetical protein [bacterium]